LADLGRLLAPATVDSTCKMPAAAQRTPSNLPLQMPAWPPVMSEPALTPSQPSHRLRQCCVICFATCLTSCMNGAAAAADSAESLCAMLLLKGVMEVALCRPARIEATNQCHTQGVGPGGGGGGGGKK